MNYRDLQDNTKQTKKSYADTLEQLIQNKEAAALDPRIQSAVSCSYFNTRDQYAFTDWCLPNAANTFDDAQIACLVYPRRLCLEMGNQDILFDHRRSTRSYEIIKELAKEHGTDWVELIIFEGLHEFHRDDAPIIRLVNELK